MGGCDMEKATLPWTQRVWGAGKILGYKQGNVPRGTFVTFLYKYVTSLVKGWLYKNKFGGYKDLPLSLGGI